MAVYVFKVYFEEFEDVVRTIHIKGTQTFEDLHNAIQDAIGFDKSQLASFYFSDDTWRKGEEVTLMDMTHEEDEEENSAPKKLIMSKSKIAALIIDPHQKLVYVFDFMEMWTLYVELTNILSDNPKMTYPAVVKSVGKAPKQYENLSRFKASDDNEFDEIARSLIGDKFDVENDSLEGEDHDEDGEEESSGLDEHGADHEDEHF